MTLPDETNGTTPPDDQHLIEEARRQVEDAWRQAADETVTAGPEGPSFSPPSNSIPGYRLVREIHSGGQGVVYQAIQETTKRKVAIKVLLEGPYASESAKRRFEREIELVAQLKHPNIISIFHSGVTNDGHQYCVMDYVRGEPLNHHVCNKKLPLEDVLELFAKVCDAVNYAHQKGVIHRDLKPSNIIVDTDGKPRVLDFGLARTVTASAETLVSITGQVIGTLRYMSPEQTRGNPDEIDIRTDVYALGVILYELLTGQYPYPVVGNMIDILRHIAETPPLLPSRQWTKETGVTHNLRSHRRSGQCPIDADINTIVMRALAKDGARRYQTAGDLTLDIRHYLADEPIQARSASILYLLRVWFRNNLTSALSVLIAGSFFGTTVGLAVYWLMSDFALWLPFVQPRDTLLTTGWAFWLGSTITIVALMTALSMGSILVAAVHPRDRSSDVITGLGAGVVAGTLAYSLGIGWIVLVGWSQGPLLLDLFSFDDFVIQNDTQSAKTLARKILLENTLLIRSGIWRGVLFSLVTFGLWSVCQTMVAGLVVRRGDRVLAKLWYYSEITVLAFFLVYSVGIIVFADVLLPLLLAFMAVGVAFGGIRRSWDFRLRFGLYAICLIPLTLQYGFEYYWGAGQSHTFSPAEASSVLVVFAAVSISWFLWWRKYGHNGTTTLGHKLCNKCGYDVRGQVVARCPECGHDFSSGLIRSASSGTDGHGQ